MHLSFRRGDAAQNSHLPDQPIMQYVHPSDRRRPWLGVAVGLATFAGMLAMSVLGRNFGTLDHLKQFNAVGVCLTTLWFPRRKPMFIRS